MPLRGGLGCPWRLAPGRQPRAKRDQDRPRYRADGELLSGQPDQEQGDDGHDVGDDRGGGRASLVDQQVEKPVGEAGVDDSERCQSKGRCLPVGPGGAGRQPRVPGRRRC